jgi:hypothetical protein
MHSTWLLFTVILTKQLQYLFSSWRFFQIVYHIRQVYLFDKGILILIRVINCSAGVAEAVL